MNTIEITKEPVELYKILKFEGLAESGGQAKAMIDAGLVLLNGEVETQKRKKIMGGDIITVEDHHFSIQRL
jgi:ribosome-associated protein